MQVKHMLALGIDVSGAKKYINVLNQARATAKKFGIDTTKSAKLVGVKQTQVFQKGKVVAQKYTATLVDGNKKISASFKQAGKSTTYLSSGVKKVKDTVKKTTPIANQLTKALKRVAIVVPVWLLFRSAMMAVFRTISEGFQYWMDFDKSIQKSKQVVHDFTGTLDNAVELLTTRIRELSIETGQSMAKLSDSFYRFGTIGLDFETSMEGMAVTTKLANTMFGNNEQIARMLAQAYKLLGDSMDKSIPVEERLLVTGALIRKLWTDNAFEIGEFSGAMERFLATANIYNFTMEESLALMATLHSATLKSTRAGRMMSTSVIKMMMNLDKMASTLGIHVNPALDSSHDILMKVIDSLHELSVTGGKIPVEALKGLDLFGGVRQRQAPQAIIAMYETLIKNQAVTIQGTKNHTKAVKELNKANDEVLASAHKQVERFDNLRKMIGEGFVQGVFGGENFKESMKELNAVSEESIDFFKALGRYLRNTFGLFTALAENVDPWLKQLNNLRKETKRIIEDSQRLSSALSGAMDIKEMKILLKDMKNFREEFTTPAFGKTLFEVMGVDRRAVVNTIQTLIWRMEKEAEQQKIEVPMNVEDMPEYYTKEGQLLGKIGLATENRLKLMANELKYIGMQNEGINKSVIAEEKLVDFIRAKVKEYNLGKDVVEGELDAIKEQEAITLALTGDYEQLLGMFLNFLTAEEDVLAIEKMRQAITKQANSEAQTTTQLLVQNELTLAKLRGASAVDISIMTIALKEQFNLYKDGNSALKDQVKLEQEITRELLGQNKLSSDSIKLWKVAQKYGTGVAQEIGAVISGLTDPSQLSRVGQRIFGKEFKGRADQFKAQRYFAGAGAGIPRAEAMGTDLGEAVEKIKEAREQIITAQFDTKVKADIKIAFEDANLGQRIATQIEEALEKEGVLDIVRDYFGRRKR